MTDPQFRQFDAESYLAKRLKDRGAQIFTGITDPAIRKERFRAAIIDAGLDYTVVGKNLAGRSETYADLYARLYAESLHLKAAEMAREPA